MNENTDATEGTATLVVVSPPSMPGELPRAAAAVGCRAGRGSGAGAPGPRQRCVADRSGRPAEAADQDGR